MSGRGGAVLRNAAQAPGAGTLSHLRLAVLREPGRPAPASGRTPGPGPPPSRPQQGRRRLHGAGAFSSRRSGPCRHLPSPPPTPWRASPPREHRVSVSLRSYSLPDRAVNHTPRPSAAAGRSEVAGGGLGAGPRRPGKGGPGSREEGLGAGPREGGGARPGRRRRRRPRG